MRAGSSWASSVKRRSTKQRARRGQQSHLDAPRSLPRHPRLRLAKQAPLLVGLGEGRREKACEKYRRADGRCSDVDEIAGAESGEAQLPSTASTAASSDEDHRAAFLPPVFARRRSQRPARARVESGAGFRTQ